MADLEQMASKNIIHYTELTPNPENAREEYDIENMAAKIKAAGGVLNSVLVFPAKYNIDGKRVLLDGNTRWYALDWLAKNDPEYNGSFEIKYNIVPETIAGNPKKCQEYMYILGTSNKELTAKEKGKLILSLYNANLAEVEAENTINTPSRRVSEAKKRTGASVGIDTIWVSAILRIEENKDEYLESIIDSGIIPFSEVPKMLGFIDKHKMPTQNFVELCQESSKQRGKAGKITRNDIQAVSEVLEKGKDVAEAVKSGVVPFALVDKCFEIAEQAGTDFNGIVAEASEFLGDGQTLEESHLERAKQILIKQNSEYLDDSEETETDFISLEAEVAAKVDQIKAENTDLDDDSAQELAIKALAEEKGVEVSEIQAELEASENENENSEEITPEMIAEAKLKFADVVLFIENLQTKDFEGLKDDQVLRIIGKLEGIKDAVEKTVIKNSKEADKAARLAEKEAKKAAKLAEVVEESENVSEDVEAA